MLLQNNPWLSAVRDRTLFAVTTLYAVLSSLLSPTPSPLPPTTFAAAAAAAAAAA
jgi:hypothetical protein